MKAFTHGALSTYLHGKGHRYSLSDLRRSLSLTDIDTLVRLGGLRWEGNSLVVNY